MARRFDSDEDLSGKRMTPEQFDTDNPWRLLQLDRGGEAVEILRERYEQRPTPRNSIALGTSLLWVGDYVTARGHFRSSLEKANRLRMGSERDYAFLGTAEWCLDNCSVALECWQAGKAAPYAVLGVCIESPMLLFIASTLKPELPLNTSAVLDGLKEELSDPRTTMWPGTLAQFIAGLTSIEAVQSSWTGNREQNARGVFPDCRWKTEFYRELLQVHEGRTTLQRFRQVLANLVDPDRYSSWEEDDFIHLIRFPEFYISRHCCPN